MSKAKIEWGVIVSFVFMGFIALLWLATFTAIHTPVPPPSINLPLGEHNRTETLHLKGSRYGISSDAYIVKYDVTLQTLPRSAWCDGSSNSSGKFLLDCTWPTPEQPVPFASAEIEVPLTTSEGVSSWEFNRATLQVVPVMQGWFWFNIGYLLFLVIFSLVLVLACILFLCACLNARDRAKKNKYAAA